MSRAPNMIMMSAHALCPTEMSHPDRMRWMANYFMEHYRPDESDVIGTDCAFGIKFDDGKEPGWVRSKSDPVVALFSKQNAENLCINDNYTVRKVRVVYFEDKE